MTAGPGGEETGPAGRRPEGGPDDPTAPASAAAAGLLATAARIDRVCAAVAPCFHELGKFAAELQIALAVQQLRELMTPEFMAPCLSLMNTELGFMTDRGRGGLDGDGKPVAPYTADEARDAIIEARLRGFHVIGNEFNILGRKFYATKHGLRRKVTQHPEVFDFKDAYEVPRLAGDGRGAIVRCSATWTRHDRPESIACEFAIRASVGQGADAILGKAERKLMARIYARLSGNVLPEGEVEEPPAVGAAPEPPAEVKFAQRRPPPAPAAARSGEPEPAPEPAAAPAPEPAPRDQVASPGPAQPGNGAAQTKLRDVVEGRGFTLDHWLKLAAAGQLLTGAGVAPERVTHWLLLPESVANNCLANPVAMIGELAAIKAQEKLAQRGRPRTPPPDDERVTV